MGTEHLREIGLRLVLIRGQEPQSRFAETVGVHKNTLGSYERGEREISALALARLVELGWNSNWVLTGKGPEQMTSVQSEEPVAQGDPSQPLRPEALRVAIQLAEEALDGGQLEPEDYAELVTLIYDALVNGLPSAQVLAFARPAARGIKEKVDVGTDVDKPGKAATR